MNALVIADQRTYDNLAQNLIEKGYYGIEGIFRSYRPPLYPFFLSLLYRALGHSYAFARLVQAGLASVSCLLLFFIARYLCGPRVALLASFFAAVDFSLIHLSGLFLSENLYIPLSILLILLLMDGFMNPRIVTFVIAGLIGGLTALCRPVILPFLIAVGLVPVFQKASASLFVRKEFRRLKPAATGSRNNAKKKLAARASLGWVIMLITAAATIAPWTIRNFRIHHRFVAISTNGGVMLWMGLHPGAPGGYHFPEEDNPLYRIRDEVERERLGIRESIRFIIGHPGEFLKLAAIKMKLFWRGYLFTMSGKQWLIFLILGTGGLFLTFRDWRKWSVIYIYLLSFVMVHVLVHSAQRYRWPLNPLIEIWAAIFCVRIWEMIKGTFRLKKKAFFPGSVNPTSRQG